MYGTLTNPKPFSGLAHGGAVLDDIGGQLTGPLLYVPFQSPTLPIPNDIPYYMPGWEKHAGKQGFFVRFDVASRRAAFPPLQPWV